MTTHPGTAPHRDAGFTLLEVIVAMVLLGVIATAALRFTAQGYAGTRQLQRTQAATMLANQTMEQVRSLAATATPGLSGVTALATGRTAAQVADQWTTAGDVLSGTTWPASDPTATSTSTPALPLSTTTAVEGTTFTIATLVGTCYRLREGSAACDQGVTPEPRTNAAYAAMARVLVRVSWDPAGAPGACGGQRCTFRLTSLVDPAKDLTWRSGAGVKAAPDTGTAKVGTATTLSVLANDIGTPASTNPVRITTAPTFGTAQARSDGTVTFTPSATGTATFVYDFLDVNGRRSNAAQVTVTVTS